MEVGVETPRHGRFTRRERTPLEYRAGVDLFNERRSLAPSGIRTPDRPARCVIALLTMISRFPM
jgi:hypothetical protein